MPYPLFILIRYFAYAAAASFTLLAAIRHLMFADAFFVILMPAPLDTTPVPSADDSRIADADCSFAD